MGRRIALLVGNARFAQGSELEPLRGPPNDVAALGDVLADPERGDFMVRRFVDERRDGVLPAIEEALNAAEADDLVVLFYAGHGRLDPSGRLCLATAETRTTALRATSIPVSELKELVAQSRAGSVVLLLDCCFSGAIGKEFLRGGDVDSQLAQMREAQGLHILTAATGLQSARERDSDSGGVVMGSFTRAIVDGIASGAADRDGDGTVTLADLRRHVAETLRGQTPKYLAHEASGEPVIARVKPRESPAERRARRLGAWYAEGALPDELYAAMSVALEDFSDAKPSKLLRRLLDNPQMTAKAVIAAWEGAVRPAPPPPRVSPPPPSTPPPPPPRAEASDTEPRRGAALARGSSGDEILSSFSEAPPPAAGDRRTRLTRLFGLDALPFAIPDRADAALAGIAIIGLLAFGAQTRVPVIVLPVVLLGLIVQKQVRAMIGVRARRRGAPPPDEFLRGRFTSIDFVVILVAILVGSALISAMNYSARSDAAAACTIALPVIFVVWRRLSASRGWRKG